MKEHTIFVLVLYGIAQLILVAGIWGKRSERINLVSLGLSVWAFGTIMKILWHI